jgi:hypothetical protein
MIHHYRPVIGDNPRNYSIFLIKKISDMNRHFLYTTHELNCKEFSQILYSLFPSEIFTPRH